MSNWREVLSWKVDVSDNFSGKTVSVDDAIDLIIAWAGSGCGDAAWDGPCEGLVSGAEEISAAVSNMTGSAKSMLKRRISQLYKEESWTSGDIKYLRQLIDMSGNT